MRRMVTPNCTKPFKWLKKRMGSKILRGIILTLRVVLSKLNLSSTKKLLPRLKLISINQLRWQSLSSSLRSLLIGMVTNTWIPIGALVAPARETQNLFNFLMRRPTQKKMLNLRNKPSQTSRKLFQTGNTIVLTKRGCGTSNRLCDKN